MSRVMAGTATIFLSLGLAGMSYAREALSVAELTSSAGSTSMVENSAYLRPAEAFDASAPFSGTIKLSEALMTTNPAKLKSDNVLGKNPVLFPGVSLSFTTVGDDLVPLNQDVIRSGALKEGKSFWDIIVQPGKVWSEKGDDGWNRASFPFSLMHSIESETHNGVATFVYKEGEVSNLRIQVLNQTAPFYVEDRFTAAALVPAKFTSEVTGDPEAASDRFNKAMQGAYPVADWAAFTERFGQEAADRFDSDIDDEERVASAVAEGGKLYIKTCPTPMGELPYCDRQRFGVWSVTKAATNEMAMLSLAEKFGDGIYDEKISDLIPESAGLEGWDRVTLGNLVNMASGMGYGSDAAKPYAISDPFIEPYYAWYEAPTVEEKLKILLPAAKPYPWKPGEVVRYRDEDMFLLGVALSRYVQQHDYKDVWDYLEKEVYIPVGIVEAPTNRTIEADPESDQPMMAFGYYPTLGDLARLADLIHQDGQFEGKQILSAKHVRALKAGPETRGLPTGARERPYYREAFWYSQMDSKNGCPLYYPVMTGFGANFVAIFPKDITVIRMAKNLDDTRPSRTMDSFEDTADAMADLCE